MSEASEERDEILLATLELIENDLETLALSALAILPPLIHLSLPEHLHQHAEALIQQMAGLGEAHGNAAKEIRARLKETLNQDNRDDPRQS